MKVLAIGRPRAGADVRGEVVLHAAEEMRALWQLYRDGVVREMYMPGQQPGAVLVLETPAIQDAEAALASLPLVTAGVIEFELTELRPFAAFSVLFAGQPPM
jgi:hypothetical protein